MPVYEIIKKKSRRGKVKQVSPCSNCSAEKGKGEPGTGKFPQLKALTARHRVKKSHRRKKSESFSFKGGVDGENSSLRGDGKSMSRRE